MKPLIIIGTGLAGYNLAKEFRKIDPATPLILITEDNGHFYSKPQLSTALANGKTPHQLIISEAKTMALQLNAQILTHTKVTAIDSAQQTITIKNEDNEKILGFRDLVLAIGASPKPFEKIDNQFRINSLEDYENFIANTKDMKRLAIIGSGLVGCEFAHDLIQKIKTLHVITPDPHPLYRLVPPCIGEALQKHLEALGICFHTSTLLCHASVHSALTLSLTNNKEIELDGILTAIGLHPNITLAKNAQIETKQGIVVDDLLKTNQPHIFALGDCAQIQGGMRQFVAPLLQSARALAQTLCANPTPIDLVSSPIVLKVSTYPVIVNPPTTFEGQWHFEIYPDGIKALFKDPLNQLLGYALSGSQIVHRQTCLNGINTREKIIS